MDWTNYRFKIKFVFIKIITFSTKYNKELVKNHYTCTLLNYKRCVPGKYICKKRDYCVYIMPWQ